MKSKIKISVGIPACNEEKDIEQVILAIIRQRGNFKLTEIIIVVDGCVDKTEEIVRGLNQKFRNIILISRKKRRGKNVAINEILALSKTNLVIIANADNLPSKNSISELLKKMKDDVGLVGPQAICQLSKKPNLTEKINQILWSWHHQIALKNPKIVSFMLVNKTAINKITYDFPVDEPLIEALVKKNGYRVVYAPKAKLFIKPPSLLSEHISRRRSIHFGYFKMAKANIDYSPPTMERAVLIKLFLFQIRRQPMTVTFAAATEIFSHFLGYYDHIRKKKNQAIWIQATSSKGLKKC
ncbi:MAG: glycosyltransferase [Candidatus Berkelbacteria bacterium]|nr:glycosyltransferase [Candidatus Berkelbacteria bacterium]